MKRLGNIGAVVESRATAILAIRQRLPGNVKDRLGFDPTVDLKTTVTYFLLWDGAQWRDGAHLPTAEFQKAKAAGHFYSLTAMSTEGGSSLFWLQSRPTR